MYMPREPDNTPFNGSYIRSTKMPNLSFKWGWGWYSKVYSTVNYLMVAEALVPQSRIRLGWSVIIRSMHEGFLLGSKFVGSEIT